MPSAESPMPNPYLHAVNYFLYSDSSSSPIMVPPGLSQFFEMYQGFESESEFSQVEKILGLDLSMFQQWNAPDGKDVKLHDLDAMLFLTQQLIKKVRDTKDLHERVEYSAMPQPHLQEKLIKLALEGDKKKIEAFIKEWQHTPDSAFPPDTGYIRKGFLLQDLEQFEKMLMEMKLDGAKKVNITYM